VRPPIRLVGRRILKLVPEAAAIWTDARLAGTRFGDIRWFTSIDSTNRYLLDLASQGAPEGTVAVADEQRAGRGRLGRSWVAPPGASLLVSVLLRPQLPSESFALVTMAAGLAAIEAVRACAGIDARLKWPNDVVVDDRKLAGILAEKQGDAVVVGMGLNVHWKSFPDDLAATATACNLLGGHPTTREDVLATWLVALDARLRDLDRVADDARRTSATVGRRVRVELADRAYEAEAVGLTDAGLLVVRTDAGTETAVSSADVVHLRPRD
jgi:BirA family transcriptional regulator, biotin operon repressor / biotin---[acetyl-CoA-carboxylase] ligase